jgi:hypothetical protein
MSLKIATLALAAFASATQLDAPNKATDTDHCEPCNPQGATATNLPAIGPGLSSLYLNILSSVKDIHFRKKRSIPSLSARDSTLCCRASLDCVNLQALNIPMCYDKFTTNFAFAGNSYGSLTTGEFFANGETANLLTGNYAAGNIYADKPADKPNTATLSIPPRFTGTGVGSAVPANELGSVLTIPVVSQSVVVGTVNGSVATTTVTITQTKGEAASVGASSMAAGSKAKSMAGSGSTSIAAASASASSTAAAGRVGFDAGVGMVGLVFGVLGAL